MKLPGIFELTKREQRAVILIVMTLLAAAIAKHYRDQRINVTTSTPVETSAPSLSEETEAEDDESE